MAVIPDDLIAGIHLAECDGGLCRFGERRFLLHNGGEERQGSVLQRPDRPERPTPGKAQRPTEGIGSGESAQTMATHTACF